MINQLTLWGWNSIWENTFAVDERSDGRPARVISEERESYWVVTEEGETQAVISGRLRYEAQSRADYPAVGDWVAVKGESNDGGQHTVQVIHAIMPRYSKLSRKMAGFVTDEQIIASNVDTVFVVTALGHDLKMRRLERTLALIWDSGAAPVVVLTKADVPDEAIPSVEWVEREAPGVPVHAVSALSGTGLDALAPYLGMGKSVAFIGSSGVGKSTLINVLLGERIQATADIRKDDEKGRHTTTRRSLFRLPTGALVMDTPGMRELQLWEAEQGVSTVFSDVESLSALCQFRDCSHRHEVGCAVRAAVADGSLAEPRYIAFQKLASETRFMARKVAESSRKAKRAKARHYREAKWIRDTGLDRDL